MKRWLICITTIRGSFLESYFGYRTKKEAKRFAKQYRKHPETLKVEVIKAEV